MGGKLAHKSVLPTHPVHVKCSHSQVMHQVSCDLARPSQGGKPNHEMKSGKQITLT